MQALLRDRIVPVSRDASSASMTFGAVAYECFVPPAMRVAPGPPHLTPFLSIPW